MPVSPPSSPSTARVILVTGGNGFLGQAVIRRVLQQGYAKKIFMLVRAKQLRSGAIVPPAERLDSLISEWEQVSEE